MTALWWVSLWFAASLGAASALLVARVATGNIREDRALILGGAAAIAACAAIFFFLMSLVG